MNEDEEEVDEEKDDAGKEKAEVVRMRQVTDVMLERRKVKDEMKKEEAKKGNGGAATAGPLKMHDQT